MFRERIACQRVDQYVELAPIVIEPLDDVIELVGIETELAAPAGMWADGATMEATETNMAVLPDRHSDFANPSLLSSK